MEKNLSEVYLTHNIKANFLEAQKKLYEGIEKGIADSSQCLDDIITFKINNNIAKFASFALKLADLKEYKQFLLLNKNAEMAQQQLIGFFENFYLELMESQKNSSGSASATTTQEHSISRAELLDILKSPHFVGKLVADQFKNLSLTKITSNENVDFNLSTSATEPSTASSYPSETNDKSKRKINK